MTPRLVLGTWCAGVCAAVLLTGCGPAVDGAATPDGARSGTPDHTHVMSDGTVMDDSEMAGGTAAGTGGMDGMDAGAHAPSEAAAMICSDEIADTVRRTFDLEKVPFSRDTWVAPSFRCDYAVGGSTLRLSVQDLDTAGPGRAYFRRLESRLPGATPLRGLQGLGLPSFETRAGDVVFLKDHKTLRVDPADLAAADLPAGYSRRDVAYAVASAVVACWSE